MKDKPPSVAEALRAAKQGGAPEHYTNGCTLGLGSSDIVILLERNNDPVAIVNLSFTSAKSLAVGIGALIAQIEERAQREIMTSNDIDGFFEKDVTVTPDVLDKH
jgi:predicted ThiF/HesA family dinucleotide-utilizing enzyme